VLALLAERFKRAVRRKRFLVVMLFLAVSLAFAALARKYWIVHHDFSNQIPGLTSDVSYQQALKDYSLSLPANVSNLKYSATTEEDYPFVILFSTDCRFISDFTTANSLTSVPSKSDMRDDFVYYFAEAHGWSGGDIGERWYERPVKVNPTIEMLIQPSNNECMVYIAAHNV